MPESYFHSPEDNDDYIPYLTVKKNHSSYGRIPYRKLLYTVEWNEKRRKILNRDKYTCQRCNKEKPNAYDRKSISALFAPQTNFIGWHVVGNNRIIDEPIKCGFYWLVNTKKFEKSDQYNGFRYVKTPSGNTLIKAESFKLHVHHKIYILNILPWQNYDKDLVTLCKKCHKHLHSKEVIKCFNREGDKLEPIEDENCERCGGSGYLPEFKHVEHGICFRCYGGKSQHFSIPLNHTMFETRT